MTASTPELGARRALLILVAYLAAQLVTGLVVGLPIGMYLGMRGRGLAPETAAALRNASILASALLGQLVAVLVVLRMATRGLGWPGALARIGWTWPRPRHLVVGAVLGLALSAVYLLVLLRRFPPAPDQPWGPFVTAAMAPGWPRTVWALTAVFVAPPVEELVFRGVLWAGFSRGLGPLAAGALVTALFAAFHMLEAFAYWPALVMIAAVGAAAVVVRAVAGSLPPAMALHGAYNLGIVAAMLRDGG